MDKFTLFLDWASESLDRETCAKIVQVAEEYLDTIADAVNRNPDFKSQYEGILEQILHSDFYTQTLVS